MILRRYRSTLEKTYKIFYSLFSYQLFTVQLHRLPVKENKSTRIIQLLYEK